MSTIAPSRLNDVSNAALFRDLTNDNFTILAEAIAKRVATYQNGSPTTIIGPPTSGTHVLAEFWRDALGGEWVCTSAGAPGTWKQTIPAAVASDPASGTIPTGYLVWNVADGAVKRHAGAYSWEITVGATASAKLGFHGAPPTAQRANANQAAATDLATVIALANELRAALVEKGVIKGSA